MPERQTERHSRSEWRNSVGEKMWKWEIWEWEIVSDKVRRKSKGWGTADPWPGKLIPNIPELNSVPVSLLALEKPDMSETWKMVPSEVGRHQGTSVTNVCATSCLLRCLHLAGFWRQHRCIQSPKLTPASAKSEKRLCNWPVTLLGPAARWFGMQFEKDNLTLADVNCANDSDQACKPSAKYNICCDSLELHVVTHMLNIAHIKPSKWTL